MEEKNISVRELEAVYSKVMKDGISEEETIQLIQTDPMKHMKIAIVEFINEKKESSCTAKLCIQYLEYIDLVKQFICAERTSNWHLHLHTVTKMVNLFAATGHINYGRCTRLYLQEMMELPEKHPWLNQQFLEGNHAIRRSNRFWAGLWSDLVIEQTLMLSIKSSGDLTRGRGFREDARHIWVMSISHTALVHELMTSLSDIKVTTSEQHSEFGKKSRKRDSDDCRKFYQWFERSNPFTFVDGDLHSLSTVVVSESGKTHVNAEES